MCGGRGPTAVRLPSLLGSPVNLILDESLCKICAGCARFVALFTLRLRRSKLYPPLFCCLRNLRSRSGRHHPFLPAGPFASGLATEELHRCTHSLQLLSSLLRLFLPLRFFLPQCRQYVHESSGPDILLQ